MKLDNSYHLEQLDYCLKSLSLYPQHFHQCLLWPSSAVSCQTKEHMQKGSVQSCVWTLELDMKHLKKAKGCINQNIMNITIKMMTIVQKLLMIKILILISSLIILQTWNAEINFRLNKIFLFSDSNKLLKTDVKRFSWRLFLTWDQNECHPHKLSCLFFSYYCTQ